MNFKREYVVYIILCVIAGIVLAVLGVRELFYGKQSFAVAMLLISLAAALTPYVIITMVKDGKDNESSDEHD